MKVRIILFLAILATAASLPAQTLNSRTLLTVDGRKIEAGEFIRMYNKSIDPARKLSIDDYLTQFIIFKLKVADALREKMDTTTAFKAELNGYRTQLAQSYLTDNQQKEKLLKSAYQRSLTEINAWHLLIGLSPDAIPEDTLKAWKKAVDIRERIQKGEPFEQVARSSSDDKTVLLNGGNLGYFTVFQMIMPFEDAAYSLKPGSVSEPVRSAYGYHIIKVTDKRPSRGRIKVAHIMKSAPPGISESESTRAREEIDSVYEHLQRGADFADLAGKYSDHRESAARGGEMDWFGTGEIISDFSEAAFALRDTGTFTKPVRTLYGWHIIKLLSKQAPRSFDESRSFLESRLNQSYLNSISRRSFIDRLKNEYKYVINQDSRNWFIINTDTLLIQGLRKYDRTTMPDGNLYTFADQRTTNREFATYIERRGYMIETRDSVAFINRSIETKAADQLVSYENTKLETKYPEFRYLMNEFHDGILLFEISAVKVWNRINTDSAGLMKYYDEHKFEHLSEPGIKGKIYTLRISDGKKALETAYKKYSSRKDPDALLIKKFNRKADSTLVITEGEWYEGDHPWIKVLKRNNGAQFFEYAGFPSVINITNLIEPVPLPFMQVQDVITTDWQSFLESSWIEQLKNKYGVIIDNVVLGEVKKSVQK